MAKQYGYFSMVDVEHVLTLRLYEAKDYVIAKMEAHEKFDKRNREKLEKLVNYSLDVDSLAFGLNSFF